VKPGLVTNPELLKRTAYIAWHWREGYELFPTTRTGKRTKRT
jgi:hypothetical protein